MRKRIWMMLFISTILSLVFAIVTADNSKQSGLYSYTMRGNGTAIISNYDWKNSNGDVYIPSMLDGYTVTGIEEYAFANGQKPVTVIIPNTVTTIGDFAFKDSQITSVSIPDSVRMIGVGAFAGCNNVTMFNVAPANSVFASVDGAIYHKEKKMLVAYPIAANPKIPNGILTIGDYACYGITLHSLQAFLPGTVSTIGNHAFEHATISIELSNRTKLATVSSKNYSNRGLYEISNTLIPKFIKSIGQSAFENAQFYMPIYEESTGNWRTDGSYSVYSTKLYGNSISSLGDSAFKNVKLIYPCDNKDSRNQSHSGSERDQPNGIPMACKDYAPITISIGSGCQSIPPYAFYGISLISAEINKGEYTGEVYSTLYTAEQKQSSGNRTISTNFVVPSEIISFGEYSFANISVGIAIKANNAIQFVGSYAFSNSFLTRPANMQKGSLWETAKLSINLEPDSLSPYSFHECSTYSINSQNMVIFNIADGTTTIPEHVWSNKPTINQLPSSILTIGAGSFGSIERIDLSNTGIVTIPNGAFKGNRSLTNCKLPSSVKTIGNEAFSGCTSLSTISLPAGITEIGTRAFYGCTLIKKLTIQDEVTTIGAEAFIGTSLREVTIPASVVSIGNNAFERTSIVLMVESGSYAELWAQDNGYNYQYSNATIDWLGN
ncbi:MAG: leucine-rich repeat protein [Clostridia bacterium]|nr:leucine-rich repeat protein [Clostridia bacterium]